MYNQTRIIIENVLPQIDCGEYYIKRIVNQDINVTADIFSDGHDIVESCVKFKQTIKNGKKFGWNLWLMTNGLHVSK